MHAKHEPILECIELSRKYPYYLHGRDFFLEPLTPQEIPIRLAANFDLTEPQPHPPQEIPIPFRGGYGLCIFCGTAQRDL